MKRATLTAAAPMLIAVLAAGCGSSNSSSSSKSTSGSSTPAASTPATTGTPAASGPVAVVTTKHHKLGTILAAGSRHMTVYLFEADAGPASSCSGACAQLWPPLTTAGAPRTTGAAAAAQLGTITRSDGTKQVTYKGHPLYFYKRDGDAGDAYGQGLKSFGAGWYVLAPAGNKIDHS